MDFSWRNTTVSDMVILLHKRQLIPALSLSNARQTWQTATNEWEAEQDTPLWLFTRNADKIPWSVSSFSSSLSSSCRTPKMYAPYTSRSTSSASSRSFSHLSNSPASVPGAAILALWGPSEAHGCPLSLPVKKSDERPARGSSVPFS